MSGAELSDALSDMWRSVLLFVPTALAFVAILLIGYLLARLVRAVTARSLKRVGLDRVVQHSTVGRALRGSRVAPSDLCAKIAFYAVLLFGLQLAFGLWGPNAVSDLLTLVIAWLPRAFVAIVIVVVAAAIAGAARDLITGALGALPYGPLLARGTSVFILGLGLIAALEQVGIATAVTGPVLVAVLATIAGVIIVGVGGGLVRPMQRRWEAWLDRAGEQSQVIRAHARSYAQARADEAAHIADQERAAEQDRIAEQERATAAADAKAAEAAAAQRAAVDAAAVEEANAAGARDVAGRPTTETEAERTQVIPVRAPVADPHRTDVVPAPAADAGRADFVPGFDASDDESDRTQKLPTRALPDEPTQVIDPGRPASS